MKLRKKVLMTLGLAVALATAYCHISVEREDWQIFSRRIPAAFDGFRITLVTDLHGASLGADNRRLLEAVAESQPDLIAVCGDMADEVTNRAMLDPLMEGLAAVAPTFFVTGNHEWAREDLPAVLEQIAACGVTVLQDSYVTLERQGQQMVLAGAEDRKGWADQQQGSRFLERIRRETAADSYVVLLSHRNDALSYWAETEADLVLAGHGHGGVIRLPGVGGLLGVDRRFFPDNAEGLYREAATVMAVSRGLGGVRLWNRPHLPTVVLRCTP